MKSMTGMGRVQGIVCGTSVRIEIKSVNHRYCEVNLRSPLRFNLLELQIQNLLKEKLKRGRIDIFIFEEKNSQLDALEADALQSYFSYLSNIKDLLKIDSPVSLDQVLSGVSSWIQRESDPKNLWNELEPLLQKAILDLMQMRQTEGNNLKQGISDRLKSLQNMAEVIRVNREPLHQQIEERLKKRIAERVSELAALDAARLHSEILYYLDRLDVNEELDRLQSHFKHADQLLQSSEPIGRKFDFLLQEFNREFNTIASKCQDAKIGHQVVEAKSCLEQIREQIQNIE